MEPLTLVVTGIGAALGWYRLTGTSRRHPLRWAWFATALALAVGLSFLPNGASQNLSSDWLFGVAAGAYARVVHVTGRWDVWRTNESGGEAVDGHGDDRGDWDRTASTDHGAAARARQPARRAVIRWARRMFLREWRQHLAVFALISIAVAGTVLGSAVAEDVSAPPAAGFGTANRLVQLNGSDPRLGDELSALRSRFGPIDVIEDRNFATGVYQGAELRSQDPYGRYGASMLRLVSGRYPAGPGQVDVTGSLAAMLDLEVGATWHEGGRTLQVVGIVENPQNLADEFALLAPGELGPSAPLGAADSVTVLFDAGSAQTAAALPYGMDAQSPPSSSGITPALIVLAVAVLALVFVGLVAVAGFAALARRRQRALGMLAALGATERDTRLVILADGVMLGAAGAIAGVLLGLATWIAYVPRFSAAAGHVVSWTELPWWLVGCVMVLAVMAATLAAWGPARAVARMPVVAALSDRPVPPTTARRSATPPAALLIGAPVLLATSGGWGGHGGRDALFQLGGLLLSALGLALAAPFLVSRLAGLARRVPPASRLALRDLSRHRVRSAAALAAASLAVLIAMLVTLITTGRYSDPVDYFGPDLPSNQVVLYAPGDGPGTGRGPNGGDPSQDTGALARQATAIAAVLGSRDVLALDPVEADLMHRTPQKTTGDSGSLYVATPEILAHYGIAPAAIGPKTILVTSRHGLAGLSGLFILYGDFRNPDAPTDEAVDPSVQTLAALPTDTADPNLLVTEYAVHSLHLTVEPTSGWLIQTPAALSATQIDTARRMALAAGMTVETRSEAPTLAQVRNDATAAGLLIVLGVLAMMVGLIRAESVHDTRILDATGASGRARRTVTATTAGALALLAALGGTLVAYLDTAAFFGIEFTGQLSQTPTADLLLVLVGLPVAAALGGWLLSGRQTTRPAQARRE